MEEGTSLFEARLAHDLTISLEPSEVITCISGSATEVFVGSSLGRIFHFRISEKEGNRQMRPIQMIRLPIKTPIASLDYASALELLMAIANSTLYEISLETKEIINHKSEVISFSINNSPTNDNPFVLQFALGTLGKKILLMEKNNYQNEAIQRITCPGLVLSLAYNKHSICYSSGSEYFVYDIQRRVAIPLFPFDAQLLRRPLVSVVDQSEYLLVGMDGLCIFVSPSGASTRPPFHIPSPPIRNFLFSQQFIYVCTDGKIYGISNNNLRIEQVIEIDGVRTIANLDGRIFGGSNTGIYVVEPISWESQVETLLEKGKTNEALKTAEERVKNNFSDEGFLKLNDLRQKIGFQCFFEGNFEKANELFNEGELDPFELIQLIPELNNDFRATHLHNYSSIKDVQNADQDSIIDFIKKYLVSKQREEQKKLIETTLLELNILEGKVDKIKNYDQLDLEKLEIFLNYHEKHNLRAHVLFQMKNDEKAFKIWQDLHAGRLEETSFNLDVIVHHLQRTENPKAFAKTLDWLCNVDSSRIKEILNRYRCICEPNEILKALEQNKDLLIWYLEGLRGNGDFNWDTTLAIHYVEMIENDKATDPNTHSKLREILLKSKQLDRGEIGEKLDNLAKLEVEKILLEARMNPEQAVLSLIQKRELNVAEMVCTEFGHENPQLGTILLKEFLANPNSAFSTDSIGRLLNKMAGYANPEEIVKQLPPGTTLNEISGFLSRSLSFVDGRRAAADMGAYFATIRVTKEGQPNANFKQKPVLMDEDSTCAVCKRSVSLIEKLKILSTGFVIHADCMPHPHLCPVTNQIFPEQMFEP
ncbi:unnamed protein product, partial [Mesorhabditis belari]|uniref:CNH domain-containing protein n=1 Tax=Mesorhabditis belari TaxID=2138241 RepID=A0AAF3EH95_9BILA